MRDIEWLKETIKKLPSETSQYMPHEQMVERPNVLRLIDQLDEPEALSQEWIDNHAASAYTIAHYSEEDVPVVTVSDLEKLLVPKLDLPEIPEYVANHIEIAKNRGDTLAQGYSISTYYKEGEWLLEKENCELFARAWLDGYQVEEKKYYIKIGPTRYARKYLEDRIDNQLAMFEKDAGVFTEKEILKLENGDKLWAFAEEVTE